VILYKTVANVVSTVPASEYMDKLYNGTIPSLEFVPVNVESASLIISSLNVQKARELMVFQLSLLEHLLIWARLVTVLINKCIKSSRSVEAGYHYS